MYMYKLLIFFGLMDEVITTIIESLIIPKILTTSKTKSKIYCLNGSIEEVKENPLHGINSDYFLINIHFLRQELK